MIYLIALLTIFAIGYWHYYQQKTPNAGSKILLFLFFWLFAGLSWQTGVDWKVYAEIYKYSLPIGDALSEGRFYDYEMGGSSSPEVIYSAISSFAKTFSDEYVFLHCIVSLIGSILFFKAMSRYSTNIFFVVMLYFGCIYITLNMSGIRQGLALAIVCYTFSYILDKKFWKYALLILLAGGVHMTALLLLPLYFIVNRRFSSTIIYILTSVGLIIYILRISIMLKMLSYIANLSGNALLAKLLFYLETVGDDIFQVDSVSPKILVYVAVVLIITYLRKQIIEDSRSTNMFFNLFVIYILLNLYFWDTGEIVMRFGFYFLLGLCFLLPIVLNKLKYKSNQNIVIVLMLLIAFISRTPVFLESPSVLPYNPYQNYIWYQITDQPSTGEDRLKQWITD